MYTACGSLAQALIALRLCSLCCHEGRTAARVEGGWTLAVMLGSSSGRPLRLCQVGSHFTTLRSLASSSKQFGGVIFHQIKESHPSS